MRRCRTTRPGGLPLLERALALEPDYALAHGFAAWCHEILSLRGGAREENRLAAASHARAAIAHGRGDALALAMGGFALGMVVHDRDAARQAFEAALAVSPSCALAYGFGSVVLATGGDPERAIDWGERALRLNPFDPMRFGMCFAMVLGHVQRGEHAQAAERARQVFQANSNWSYAHVMLAATQARLGHLDAAQEAASRALELQPGFTITGMCAAAAYPPSLAQPLSEALRLAGMPE